MIFASLPLPHCHAHNADTQVERSSDDTVKLKILQTTLTLLQNPHIVDDKVGVYWYGGGEGREQCGRMQRHPAVAET